SGNNVKYKALFSIRLPGDELVYMTGMPYDTLEEVIWKRSSESGSLKELQVEYKEVSLQENGKVNYKAVSETVTKTTKALGIQRSKGYEDRPSFTINEIAEMVDYVKAIDENIIIFVD